MNTNIRKSLLLGVFIFCIPYFLLSEGLTEAVPLNTRNRYQANNGIIVPPEEINDNMYISSFDYHYPEPETDIGFYVYNYLNPETNTGRDGILQIGVQGKVQDFSDIPSLNLAFVVDTSLSMNDDEKIFWIKDSLTSFIDKIRDIDSLALVYFNDTAGVLFESAQMDSDEKRRGFLDAVNELTAEGGTKLEEGINLGYDQIMLNYQEDAINMVLLISDGNEFSNRLASALAHSGDIRISLVWNNRNDLDLHVITPAHEEIWFANMKDLSGGWLDVDRNVTGETTEPVENVFWYQGAAAQGRYQVWVQNYDYHDSEYETPFQVEIKNGDEYNYYEGIISGTGHASNTLAGTFDFNNSVSKSILHTIVESYTQQGVSISTIGVGGNFDEELLRTLAEYGRGNSRSLDNRELMQQILNTDREFERFAVPAAEDMEINVEFSPGVRILAAWGTPYRTENNHITYNIPNLNQGDYKTLLIHYQIPPQNRERLTAVLRGGSADSSENTIPERVIVLTDPADEDSSNMAIYSQARARFVEALKEIGRLYYAGGADSIRLRTALQRTVEAESELEQATLSLDEETAFSAERSVLSRYTEILESELSDSRNAAGRTSRMGVEGGRYSRMKTE
ncbi:VWA domain-containing protein [Treponema primitia]|uniref:VWA domain-containing protein n=1 Tax=Treponema primitia TaxID=88058 RepID=UPI0002554FF9|nr:VWA domain-containing protein [Treponema primitia]